MEQTKPVSNSSNKKTASEDLINQKWDKTVSSLIVNTGIGFGIGVVATTLFFRRRMWPVTFFTGAGFGATYSEAQDTFSKI
ncbi:MICOS complex subunit MIC10 [Smittium culicis]|uniref:MICOS complex subunit MIC10 n=1 Tax=Smittium culicis TaxID=133412 RepID=A0A1R1XX76_9FUNG|nr:MICOS complex subunit MIC10 [Smittium culicis]OMJ19159.1 MICOS complex subunit MIC10 [Smittium culicis]